MVVSPHRLLLRIVYDGPPDAGKATNLRQLCDDLSLDARGMLDSADGHEHAVYFDWLDFAGSWAGEHRVRCQLVTIRGLPPIARRQQLLERADVVVVVADSRSAAAPETVAAVRAICDGLDDDVPLVIQANKQDLPDAQLPDDVRQALGLSTRVPAIGAQAARGAGVLETFMIAVRAAVDHARAALAPDEDGQPPTDPGAFARGSQPDLPTIPLPVPRTLPPAPPLYETLELHELLDELDAIGRAADAALDLATPLPMSVGGRAALAAPLTSLDLAISGAVGAPTASPRQPSITTLLAQAIATRPARFSLDPELDLAMWDRLPTELDVFPVTDTDPTEEVPAVGATHALPLDLDDVVEIIEVVDLGGSAPLTGPRFALASTEPSSCVLLGIPEVSGPPAFRLPPIDLPAALMWPSVGGRAALAALTPPVRAGRVPAGWAPAGAIELACGDGWWAHTSPALVFADIELARRALLEAIRWHVRMAHLTPPGRTYALSPQADGVRLWVVTPAHRTLWSALDDAFVQGDRATARDLARRGLEAVDAIRACGAPIGDLDHLAVGEPARLLATPWTPSSDRLTAQLQRLFAAAVV